MFSCIRVRELSVFLDSFCCCFIMIFITLKERKEENRSRALALRATRGFSGVWIAQPSCTVISSSLLRHDEIEGDKSRRQARGKANPNVEKFVNPKMPLKSPYNYNCIEAGPRKTKKVKW